MHIIFIASSLSISQSILFSDILCPMLTTILHWGTPPVLEFIVSLLQTFSLIILSLDLCELSYWGIPPSLSSLTFCRLLSLLDLFLDLCESSYRGIPPLALFYWGIPPLSLGLPCLMSISWLLDPFVDLYELSPRASSYHRFV